MSDLNDVSPAPGTPQTSTKAQVATAITTIGGVLAFLLAYFPDDDKVQLWGGLIAGLLTVIATGYGVYKVPNQPTSAVGRR